MPSGGSAFSLPIINAIISSCDDLSQRSDLLLMMVDQRAISRSSDMSETFDLMARKQIPIPPEDQLTILLTHSRLNDGQNARKLARSFLRERSDDRIASFIFNYEPGSYSESKDIVISKGQLGDIPKKADLYIHEPTITASDNQETLFKFFYMTKTGKYVTKK